MFAMENVNDMNETSNDAKTVLPAVLSVGGAKLKTMDRFKNSGKIVKHLKNGKRGRTFNNKEMINGKVPVYFETEKRFVFEEKAVLCSVENLEICGFIY